MCDLDDDNDGVDDEDDAFPVDPSESVDTDDDGDGQSDADEIACAGDPRDGSVRGPDADGDGTPDCVDEGGEGGIDTDGDGALDTLDVCPATAVPEGVPTAGLARYRYALMDRSGLGSGEPTEFTTSPARFAYTTADTEGCSCEQILELTENTRRSERQRGCARSTLESFIEELRGTTSLPMSCSGAATTVSSGRARRRLFVRQSAARALATIGAYRVTASADGARAAFPRCRRAAIAPRVRID